MGHPRESTDGSRPALLAFSGLAVLAAGSYLFLGRHWWFYLDEWGFLAGRDAWSVGDLLRPYNEHWTTLPIVVWRSLWTVFGARSYVPYQVLSVSLHVVVAALCRALMRRAAVRPWVATIVAGEFLVFGTGVQNILSAFQITFTGALAFGFAQVLLADHEGAWDRRDWLALAAGALALMCSGVGVAMVAVVGVVTLMRRGTRVAAGHTLPLAAMYALWFFGYGSSGTRFSGSIGGTLAFTRTGIAATFGALGQLAGVGALLAAAMVAGLVFLSRSGDQSARGPRLALITALFAGVLVFFISAAMGRTSGPTVVDLPTQSRYLYVAAAMLAPVLGVTLDVLLRHTRVLGALALALLCLGVPGNLANASTFARRQAQRVVSSQSVLLSIGRMPIGAGAPGSLRPDPVGAPSVTLRWLRTQARDGRIPALDDPTAELLASNRLRLSLMEIDSASGRPCPPLVSPVIRHLADGQSMSIGNGAVTVTNLSTRDPAGVVEFGNVLFKSSQVDHTLVSDLGPLTIRVAPLRSHRAEVC